MIISSTFLVGSVVMLVGLALVLLKEGAELWRAIGANFVGLAKETADWSKNYDYQ